MFIEIGFQKTPASICTRKEKRKKKKGTNLSQRLTDKRSEVSITTEIKTPAIHVVRFIILHILHF
jgi:hypothetical protein